MSRRLAVIFDLDGTLIDSAPDIHAVLNTVLAARSLPMLTLAQVHSFIGHGVPPLIARVMAALGLDQTELLRDQLTREFSDLYAEAVEKTTIFPNVLKCLQDLHAAGHGLGICTNKPLHPTMAVLRHLDLTDYFTSIVGGDSLPVRKPDPAPLIKCLWELGDGGCLYVGDSEVDAATARAARLPFALVTHGYLHRPAEELGARYMFDDFAQLSGIVAQAEEDIFKG